MQAALVLLALGLLVLIHELGHLVAARLVGLTVTDLSIGLGPSLARWRVGRLTVRLGLVPFGGYVRVAELSLLGADGEAGFGAGVGAGVGADGEARVGAGVGADGEAGVGAGERTGHGAKERAGHGPVAAERFHPRAVAGRLAAIAGGPFTNYLVAAALVAASALLWGRDTGRIAGLAVTAVGDGPAARAGLRPGDVVAAVDDEPVRSVGALSARLGRSAGGPVALTVLRGGVTLRLPARPVARGARWGLGARYVVEPELERVGVAGALAAGAREPLVRSAQLLGNAAALLAPSDDRAGRGSAPAAGAPGPGGPTAGPGAPAVECPRPLGPVGLADRVARSRGLTARRALALAAVLSVAVGLFNLLPFPGLDGGRLCLELVEAARRRRLAPRVAIGIQTAGALVLLAAWIAVTVSDLLAR